MSYYEIVYLARQDLSANQIEELNTKIQDLITSLKGTVAKSEYWGLKNLAYKINKNKKAHYSLIQVQLDAEGLKEFDRLTRLNERVLRHLVVKIDALDPKPSVMMEHNNNQ